MFTGIIEEIGTIEAIQSSSNGKHLTIAGQKVLQDLKSDDSVCVDGVCLTATHVSERTFQATAVKETITKSTLGSLRRGTQVNLERALRLSDRLGGHIVQGHVDGIGRVRNVIKKGTGYEISIQLPSSFEKYALEKGSIAVNGISLTIARLDLDHVTVAVIPHTWDQTTMKNLKSGSPVNIEMDFLGKYVERFMPQRESSYKDENWYRSQGIE